MKACRKLLGGVMFGALALAGCGASTAPAASVAATRQPASTAASVASRPAAGASAKPPSAAAASAVSGAASTKPAASAKPSAAAVGGLEHVKVAVTSGSLTGAGFYIGLDRGYFKEQGLDVEIVPFPGGAQMISSLAASQVDVADTDPGAGLLNAIARDLPMRFVADGSSCSIDHCGTSFVVRKDLVDSGRFKGLNDLKGMTVNTFISGSTLYQFLYRMLDKAGLKDTDLKLTNISAFADVLPAFSNKALDASWMIEPLTTGGIDKGLFDRYQTATQLFGPQQNTLVVYSPEFASKRQDAGKKLMVGYIHGIRDYLDAVDKGKNYDATIAILIKNTTLKDPALYKKIGLPAFDPNGQVLLSAVKDNQKWYVGHGDVKNPPDLDKVYDGSYVDYALGIVGKR